MKQMVLVRVEKWLCRTTAAGTWERSPFRFPASRGRARCMTEPPPATPPPASRPPEENTLEPVVAPLQEPLTPPTPSTPDGSLCDVDLAGGSPKDSQVSSPGPLGRCSTLPALPPPPTSRSTRCPGPRPPAAAPERQRAGAGGTVRGRSRGGGRCAARPPRLRPPRRECLLQRGGRTGPTAGAGDVWREAGGAWGRDALVRCSLSVSSCAPLCARSRR